MKAKVPDIQSIKLYPENHPRPLRDAMLRSATESRAVIKQTIDAVCTKAIEREEDDG